MAWKVYLHGKLIDIVFFDVDCDHNWVYDSLVNHDGYDPAIVVKKGN